MSEVAGEFSLAIEQVQDYEFRVSFDKENLPSLTIDEPPPLGRDAGPNPSRVLASAIGSCLCASLLFCLSKTRARVKGIRADVKAQSIRNDRRRLRIGRVEVTIRPDLEEEDRRKAARCLALFEDFCTVTASIREGIDVDVKVEGIEAPA